jgi:hypothetical protein
MVILHINFFTKVNIKSKKELKCFEFNFFFQKISEKKKRKKKEEEEDEDE